MSDINEELFTDYAIGLASAYIHKDTKAFHDLLQSYWESEMKNAVFMPGLIIGMIFHLGSLINHISDCNNETPSETFKTYALSYSLSRERLVKNDMLSPKRVERFFKDIMEKGETL